VVYHTLLECVGNATRYGKKGMVILMPVAGRVPGLTIRDCAKVYNNRGQSRPMMSTIDVTLKTFFERLYLVLGLRKIAP